MPERVVVLGGAGFVGTRARELWTSGGLEVIAPTHAALDVLEDALRNRKYLVADECTLADISLYAYTHVANEGGFDLQPYPNVRAWCDRIASQPGWTPITEA